jgi:hypothetical protein
MSTNQRSASPLTSMTHECDKCSIFFHPYSCCALLAALLPLVLYASLSHLWRSHCLLGSFPNILASGALFLWTPLVSTSKSLNWCLVQTLQGRDTCAMLVLSWQSAVQFRPAIATTCAAPKTLHMSRLYHRPSEQESHHRWFGLTTGMKNRASLSLKGQKNSLFFKW